LPSRGSKWGKFDRIKTRLQAKVYRPESDKYTMKLLNVLSPLMLALMLANCSIDVSIEDMVGDDFLKSTILATSRGVGDGQTSATVVILLKNSDDSVVANYKPEFDFVDNGGSTVSGNGITFSDCVPTNDQGISTCTFRSIQVGARRVMFNNIAVELIGEVFFDAPSRNGTFFQVLSSGQIDQDASGYTVTSQIGAPFAGLKQEASGYTIMTNTTAGITPVD
jgi:hypothetical protein